MVIYLITIFTAISAILCIRAKYTGSINQLILFKPLTLLLILFMIFTQGWDMNNYKILIICGLIFSLIGDLFLIFPEKHFTKGLVSFLIGHLCYIFAFTVSSGLPKSIWILIPIIIVGIIYLVTILPHTGKLKIPVAIYITIIIVMGWFAIERYTNLQTIGSLYGTIGAIFFIISDAVLAYNKFKNQFYYAELIVLSSYFIAQWLIALSVLV